MKVSGGGGSAQHSTAASSWLGAGTGYTGQGLTSALSPTGDSGGLGEVA